MSRYLKLERRQPVAFPAVHIIAALACTLAMVSCNVFENSNTERNHDADADLPRIPHRDTLGANWVGLSSGSSVTSLNAVTWTGSQLVAAGSGGVIVTSPEGTVWTPQSSGSTRTLKSLAWSGSVVDSGAGVLIAVGDSGQVLRSLDGKEWVPQSSGTSFDLLSVRWLRNQFIAVGAGGVILTSTDGLDWVARVSGVGANLRSIDGTVNTMVAVGPSGAILSSSNGIEWSVRASGEWGALTSVASLDGRFVVTRDMSPALESSDGVTWDTSGLPIGTFYWLKRLGGQLVGSISVEQSLPKKGLGKASSPESRPSIAVLSRTSGWNLEWAMYSMPQMVWFGQSQIWDAAWTGERLVFVGTPASGGNILVSP